MCALKNLGSASLIGAALLVTTVTYAKERITGRGNPDAPVVYVTSQGLYYDSIVVADHCP